MSSIELKSDLLRILNKIEDEQLLRTVYDFLKQGENKKESEIWKSLSDKQKSEVYASFQESEDENLLIDWEVVKKKY